jgi:hypothetical protein
MGGLIEDDSLTGGNLLRTNDACALAVKGRITSEGVEILVIQVGG